ncbi:MAG: hypothetical protein AAF449_03115, partial [Myxococcota bacterium]
MHWSNNSNGPILPPMLKPLTPPAFRLSSSSQESPMPIRRRVSLTLGGSLVTALAASAALAADAEGPRGKCPIMHGAADATGSQTTSAAYANEDWWPERLNLKLLEREHPATSPLGDDFVYAEAFGELDVEALKADVMDLMTT